MVNYMVYLPLKWRCIDEQLCQVIFNIVFDEYVILISVWKDQNVTKRQINLKSIKFPGTEKRVCWFSVRMFSYVNVNLHTISRGAAASDLF